MFAPSVEEIIESLGSIDKAERVHSALFGHLEKVVPAGQRSAIDAAISCAVNEAGLAPHNERLVQSLVSLQAPSDKDVLTKLSFKSGIDPRESASIKELFKEEAEIRCYGIADTKELLVGCLFRVMEKSGYKPTWEDAEGVFNRNCQLDLFKANEEVQIIKFTQAGEKFATKVAGETAKGFTVIKDILGERETPSLLQGLADKLTPGCVLRSVNLSDAGAVHLIDKNSHILRQSVVTQIGFDKDSNGKTRVGNGVIYIADKNEPEIYPHITHELIEVGLMQHLLNRCHESKGPAGFLVQFLAESKYSDTLVWTLQFQALKNVLNNQEKIAILDRLFIVQFSTHKTIDAVGRIVGSDHPITKEMKLYQDIFNQLYRVQDQRDFVAATLEPDQRNPYDQERYGKFLLRFYGRYIEELSKQKSSVIGKDAVLCNPDLLLS